MESINNTLALLNNKPFGLNNDNGTYAYEDTSYPNTVYAFFHYIREPLYISYCFSIPKDASVEQVNQLHHAAAVKFSKQLEAIYVQMGQDRLTQWIQS